MTQKASKTSVTFSRSFWLPGYRDLFPAGNYTVETYKHNKPGCTDDEQPQQYVTLLCFHRRRAGDGFTEFLNVDTKDIEAALARDRQCAPVAHGESGYTIGSESKFGA